MSTKEKEPRPEPLPDKIIVGDLIRLNPDKRAPYRAAYQIPEDKTWTVTGQSFVSNRRRLHVEGTPTLIWANDAKCVYTWQQAERREHLKAQGASLKAP